MKNREVIIAELGDLHASFGAPEFNVATLQAPESYFRHFPDEMTAIIKLMNNEVVLPVSYKTEEAYALPENYFAQLPESLLASVKAADQTFHKGIYNWDNTAKNNPYDLPENYFSRFETELFNQVFQPALSAEAELEQLSPLLAGLKQQQVFEVPSGYFKTEVTAKAPVAPKVIEHPSVKSIKWARWAAAAAILFIFSLGAFQMFSPERADSKPTFQQSLAQIPSDSIREWLSTNMDEDDINNLGNSIAGMNTITNINLKGFTDKEIEQYIESEVW